MRAEAAFHNVTRVDGQHLIPEHMRVLVHAYLVDRVPPGDFMYSLLTNDLVVSFQRADEKNRDNMSKWAEWLYWECPSQAWGSPEKVSAWLDAHDSISSR